MFDFDFGKFGKRTIQTLTCLIGLGSAFPGMALVIDSFDQTSQHVTANGMNYVNAPEALGGSRRIRIAKSGSLGASADVLVPPGIYSQSTDALTTSTGTLTWGVPGGVDLTGGLLNPEFALDLIFVDRLNDINLRIMAMDTDGDFGVASVPIPTSVSLPTTLTMPFSVFDPTIDFNRIGIVSLTIAAGEGVDFYLDQFRVQDGNGHPYPTDQTVPEPQTLALIGIGLLPIGLLSSYRNRKNRNQNQERYRVCDALPVVTA